MAGFFPEGAKRGAQREALPKPGTWCVVCTRPEDITWKHAIPALPEKRSGWRIRQH